MRLPDPSRSRAVLIGSSTYIDASLPDLPAVRNNVTDLAAALTAPTGAGILTGQCACLIDVPSVTAVGQALENAAEHADDVLIVYYAGHGLLDNRGQLYFAVPHTSALRLRWTCIPFALIREVLADAPAANRVLIVDSCFSGRALGEVMASENLIVDTQLEVAGTYTMTSASANEPASAPSGARHTAFTGALIELLTAGSPGAPDLLTLDYTYRHLVRTMKSRGLSLPQQRGTRTIGDLALAPNQATTLAQTLHPRPRRISRGNRGPLPLS